MSVGLALALGCTGGDEVCLVAPTKEDQPPGMENPLVDLGGHVGSRMIGVSDDPDQPPCRAVAGAVSGLQVEGLRVCPLFAVSADDPSDPSSGRPLYSCALDLSVPEGDPSVTEPGREIPAGLRRYCLIEFEDSNGGVSMFARSGSGFSPDMALITGSATVDQTEQLTWFEELFSYHAGGPPAAPALNLPTAAVRLALLDGSPTSPKDGVAVAAEPEGHGEAMEQIAKQLLCRPSAGRKQDCAATVVHRLALPFRVDPDVPEVRWSIERGGNLGSLGWLAQAIRREVIAWQTTEPTSKLILNLSIGWNPADARFDDLGVEAVWAALRDAQCRGALIIAAAGNQAGACAGADQRCKGPLLPAAWGGVAGATLLEGDLGCAARTLEVDAPLEGDDDGPILFAAGGFNAEESVLAISRAGSQPPFLAYADHAPVILEGEHRLITGTSVAAVVVSSAAATQWRSSPLAGRKLIMHQLFDDGQPLNIPVDASFVDAIAGAVMGVGVRVPGGPEEPPAAPSSVWPRDGRPGFDDPQTASCGFPVEGWWESDPDACGICQPSGFGSDQLWLLPQPMESDCDLCLYHASSGRVDVRVRYNGKFVERLPDGASVSATANLQSDLAQRDFPLQLDSQRLGSNQDFSLTLPSIVKVTGAKLTTTVQFDDRQFVFVNELAAIE